TTRIAGRGNTMGEWVDIKAEDGVFGAYVARPAAGKGPAVLVIQEIFGVNADLRATCGELANRGCVAVSPDLFWRAAPRIDMNKLDEREWQRGFELYQSFNVDRGVRDIGATIAKSRALEGTSGKVGVMGFCLGGLLTFLTAARVTIDGAVSYYGGGTEQHLDESKNIKSPVVLHLAEEDEYMSKAAVEKIKAALAKSPVAQVHTYPGCKHAFARHNGAHYD